MIRNHYCQFKAWLLFLFYSSRNVSFCGKGTHKDILARVLSDTVQNLWETKAHLESSCRPE